MAIIFDGTAKANAREQSLVKIVDQLHLHGQTVKIASLFFNEDPGSVLYTRLKSAAAHRVGMQFDGYPLPLYSTPVAAIVSRIRALADDERVTGIIVQKPTKLVWRRRHAAAFNEWWKEITSAVPPDKDIDAISPKRLSHIRAGAWTLLPATVNAALIALESALGLPLTRYRPAAPMLGGLSVAVIGCSDIIGQPLAEVLTHLGAHVIHCRQKIVVAHVRAARVIVSAIGQPNTITGDMIQDGAIIIDVGSPRGDVEFSSAVRQASFITPVPGGIGPLTVISLLENAVQLIRDPARPRVVERSLAVPRS